MAFYTFTFNNTQDDQTFSYNDTIDVSKNPIVVGAVNKGDTSAPQSCWVGGGGKGNIVLSGNKGAALISDIPNDGYNFDY
jgi:hypothetical protein